jgi:hypothetical protein
VLAKKLGKLLIIERWNKTLRQRLGRSVRQTLSFSRVRRVSSSQHSGVYRPVSFEPITYHLTTTVRSLWRLPATNSSVPTARMFMISYPCKVLPAVSNEKKPIPGLTRRLMRAMVLFNQIIQVFDLPEFNPCRKSSTGLEIGNGFGIRSVFIHIDDARSFPAGGTICWRGMLSSASHQRNEGEVLKR